MRISGKVALITGAGQGIGRAIALRLASDGADIAIVDVNEDKMTGVADEVKAIGRKATKFKADVTKRMMSMPPSITPKRSSAGSISSSTTPALRR